MTANQYDNLIAWLRDAHAMEEQAETMLASQFERLGHYPELKARIGRHIAETKQHAALLKGCLDRLGDGNSILKDAAAKVAAMAQGLSGVFATDEVVKGTLANYTFEHMEIASYRILIAAAEHVGDTETAAVCQHILQDELAMAKWLEDNTGNIVHAFMDRSQHDIVANA